MYHYGPASIWISGPVGETWRATARFHYQEKDFDARSLQDVLDQAMGEYISGLTMITLCLRSVIAWR